MAQGDVNGILNETHSEKKKEKTDLYINPDKTENHSNTNEFKSH